MRSQPEIHARRSIAKDDSTQTTLASKAGHARRLWGNEEEGDMKHGNQNLQPQQQIPQSWAEAPQETQDGGVRQLKGELQSQQQIVQRLQEELEHLKMQLTHTQLRSPTMVSAPPASSGVASNVRTSMGVDKDGGNTRFEAGSVDLLQERENRQQV
jgi:CII-binding regulator of phage lambda lysogenization HflD